MGLTFTPLDDQAMDVEGILWIDAATYEPRLLEYRHSKLPWPIRTDKLGGGAHFRRLSDGALIVSRWWMRMPRVGVGQSCGGGSLRERVWRPAPRGYEALMARWWARE